MVNGHGQAARARAAREREREEIERQHMHKRFFKIALLLRGLCVVIFSGRICFVWFRSNSNRIEVLLTLTQLSASASYMLH
jgi:hypothetical protein